MEKRAKKIVETAMHLAEKGGFAAVRLRDIAAEAGVALGTVYKRFQSKEDILVAVLELWYIDFKQYLTENPLSGESQTERVTSFFTHFTNWLCARPGITRAVLRAMASGETDLAEKIVRFHGRVTMMLTAAYLPPKTPPEIEADFSQLSPQELDLLFLLQGIWFASMVGWSGGIHDQDTIITQTQNATELMLLGLQTRTQQESENSITTAS